MPSKNSVFICQSCAYKSPKWAGKCPSCGTWNSIVEEQVATKVKLQKANLAAADFAKPLHSIENISLFRIISPDKELNRVLGGGLVPGGVTLIGGEPGIGKSTLLLQLAAHLNCKVLYVSGEESETQIRLRAERTGIINQECFVLSETNLNNIKQHISALEPAVIVLDSIQTVFSPELDSASGSVSQIRECANELISIAKSINIPLFLVGHITKDGFIAGPKVLEQMVDTVLQFEGDRHYNYRMLRVIKNRFGSGTEIGIYEMINEGLREVSNPSEILITHKTEALSGIAISCAIEGARPMLIETQALVSTAVYGTPQRNSNGFDLRRLNMLLAVLEKRCGFRLGSYDVFVNITGGIKVEDPAIDLSLVAAILSSFHDMPLPYNHLFCAEVGLSGELRQVAKIEQRITEAEKLGYEKVYVSSAGKYKKYTNVEVCAFPKIDVLFGSVFG